MITDKNKEQFENWVTDNEPLCRWAFSYGENGLTFEEMDFYKLPFEMQIGVYLAYYDSLGIGIETLPRTNGQFDWSMTYPFNVGSFEPKNTPMKGNLPYQKEWFKTRNEAYKEAFKKANEIVNQKD